MWNSMPKESKRKVGTFKVWRGLRKSRKLHKGGQSMTKTWLWFRIESNTESKNGRKYRPDTKTNKIIFFQTIAMSFDLLESKMRSNFHVSKKQIQSIQFSYYKKRQFYHFLESCHIFRKFVCNFKFGWFLCQY